MKNFILLLALLLPYVSYAASGSGNVSNVVNLGSMNTTSVITPTMVTMDGANSLGWFNLTAYGAGTSGNVTPLLKNGVIYQVPSGKSTVCVGISGYTNAANSSFQRMYADNTFAFDATTGSLTNAKYEGGDVSRYVFTYYSLVPSHFASMFTFPAQKWPGIQHASQSGNQYIMTCREI